MKVNVNTGKWSDFATGDKGGDLTSLYAKINGVGQGEASKQLAEKFDLVVTKMRRTSLPEGFLLPPKGSPVPSMDHYKFGKPASRWTYRDFDGRVLFFIARYDMPEKKQVLPWTYNSLHEWKSKAWPTDRPLYNLPDFMAHPNRAVLIVEGEKAAEAAKKLCGSAYVVTTWSGGSQAFQKTDWRPCYGRELLLWPDADQAGRQAVAHIVQQLYPHCPKIKTLNVEAKPDGWDAADAVEEGLDSSGWREWAKAIVTTQKPLPPEQIKQVATDVGPQVIGRVQSIPTIRVTLDDTPSPTASLSAAYDKLGLVVSPSTGAVVCNADNVLRVIQGLDHFKDLVWFDEFHFKFFTRWNSPQVREWTEDDNIALMILLQRELGMHRITEKAVEQAVRTAGIRNVKNEPRDWMNSLVWDQQPRVDDFFCQALGAVSNDYTKAISKNFWISMIARVFRPGCKFDNMVIFEGRQGIYKSTALKTIASPWYVESNESILGKDFYLQLHGNLIVEIGELDAFSKAEVTTIKKVISTATDKFRPPYGKTARQFPRMSIFVGTTNDDEYLRDPTGGRRFWPCAVSKINVEMIEAHREQLFAEAVARFKMGESWWLVPRNLAEAEQEQRRQADPWEDDVRRWMVGQGSFTVSTLWVSCLKGDLARLDRQITMRISKILRSLGMANRVVKVGVTSERQWHRIGEPPAMVQQALPLGVSRPRNYAPGADNSHLDGE